MTISFNVDTLERASNSDIIGLDWLEKALRGYALYQE